MTIVDELELFDVLVVTDSAELRLHHEAGRMPNARLVVVADPAAPLTDADRLVLEIARAGKAIRTWCSLTDGGRRIARETAQTLNPHLPDDARVLHITDPPPHAWQPLVDSFVDLVNGARAKLPAAPKKTRRDRNQGGAPPQFDTDPESIARRIILNFGADLLIVAPPLHDRRGFSTGFALDDHGIWSSAGDRWALWMVKISTLMRFEASHAMSDIKVLAPTLAAISRIKNPKLIEPVQQMLDAALRTLREEGEPCPDVTMCRAEDLDANMRYLGVANGVVDLHTGELLQRDEARAHRVTIRCPVEYHPGATHPALDKLFSAWSPRLLQWWRVVLGHSLRAVPKRLYFAVGPPDSGKSTLGTALSKVLGRYMRTAAPDVLQKRNRSSETQLTPGLRAWHRPTRLVWINEIKETAINERLTKDLTGGGDRLAARGLHEDLVEEDVTATTFATCNPESIPRLKLTDSGMRSRYRELRYPKATILDTELKPTLCDDPAAQRALLAWLVAAAVDATTEPDDIPEILAATSERIRDDAGELGEFSRRIMRGHGVLAVAEVWQAWCEHNGEPIDAKEPGGIGKRRLSRALRDHVPDLGNPRQNTVDNNNVRGWRGRRLLSVEDAECQSAAEQALNRLQKTLRKWDSDQIDKVIPLLEKLTEGEIFEYEGSTYIGAPGYSYMNNGMNPSAAFQQAYERTLLATRAERQTIGNLGTELAILLAEKYLVPADQDLGELGTADHDLASAAARRMTDAISTASREFTPEAKLLSDELERFILWLTKGHIGDALPGNADAVATGEPPPPPPDPVESDGLPDDEETDLFSGLHD